MEAVVEGEAAVVEEEAAVVAAGKPTPRNEVNHWERRHLAC